MSERPEADSSVKTADPAPKTEPPVAMPPPEHPHTFSPPTPEKTPPKPTWSGSDRYPDGYVMTHEPDGSITLTNPDGQVSWWYPDAHGWYDAESNRRPDDWSAGHAPTTQTYGSSVSPPTPDVQP